MLCSSPQPPLVFGLVAYLVEGDRRAPKGENNQPEQKCPRTATEQIENRKEVGGTCVEEASTSNTRETEKTSMRETVTGIEYAMSDKRRLSRHKRQ